MHISYEGYWHMVNRMKDLDKIEGFTFAEMMEWVIARFGDEALLDYVRKEYGYIHPDEIDVNDYQGDLK